MAGSQVVVRAIGVFIAAVCTPLLAGQPTSQGDRPDHSRHGDETYERATMRPTDPPNFDCQSIVLLTDTHWNFQFSDAHMHVDMPAGPLVPTKVNGEWIGASPNYVLTRGNGKPKDAHGIVTIGFVGPKDGSTTMQGRMYIGKKLFLSALLRDAEFTVSPCNATEPKLRSG